MKFLWSMPLPGQILLSLLLGVAVGVALQALSGAPGVEGVLSVLQLGSDVFLRLLSMTVIPLVICTVFLGVTRLESGQDATRIGATTGFLYLLTSLISITTGLVFVNLLKPGVGANLELSAAPVKSVEPPAEWIDLLIRIVPKNPIEAMARFDMIAIIFFVIVFGIFANQSSEQSRSRIVDLFEAAYEVVMRIVSAVIKLAPIGVFCIVVKLVATTGIGVFIPLAKYVFCAALALGTHLFINLAGLLKVSTGRSPLAFLKAMSPALLTAFSSASSSATLPLTLDCAVERAGVSKKTAGIVLPLGATINMDGTALYEGIAVLFIAQVMGVDLSIGQQFIVLITALLVSVGAAGIPHAGLVMMVVILKAVGLPLEATGLIWTVDRVIDMMRTSVNVYSDCVICAVVDHQMNLAKPKLAPT